MPTSQELILGIQVSTGDGIEVSDELAHACDHSHFPEFASGQQAFVDGADGQIESSRGKRRVLSGCSGSPRVYSRHGESVYRRSAAS